MQKKFLQIGISRGGGTYSAGAAEHILFWGGAKFKKRLP
jgi:hypothetical protein